MVKLNYKKGQSAFSYNTNLAFLWIVHLVSSAVVTDETWRRWNTADLRKEFVRHSDPFVALSGRVCHEQV